MSFLLNPRVLLALALAGLLAFSHFMAYRAGKGVVRAEWNESKALANAEARRLEQARQSRADDAATSAATRSDVIRADAGRAGDAVQRLRDQLATRPASPQSCTAEAERADSLGKLLVEGAEAHRKLAEQADRHVNDIRMLLEAWPQ